MTENVETWSGKGRADENFPVGSALIAPHLRPHIHAFYNFARNADDIADSPTLTQEDKIARLNTMEAVLLGQHTTGSPSAAALRQSLAQTGVTPTHSQELLIAFRRDAVKNRTDSWDDLMDYCRHSAMPVGRHVLDLHGESQTTWPASDALCAVLQILNHLQDASKDLANLNRCYLPNDLLAQAGASIDHLFAPAESPGLRQVFNTLLAKCDTLLHTAAHLPRETRSRRLRIETAVIVNLARRLATRLRTADPIATRVKLTKPDAALAILRALLA
jgi:farnesyl-diphosphate farnesyltransferase